MTFKTEEAKLREEIEKKNKLHREQAKKLKIEPLSDNGWEDTIELEAKLQQFLADKKMFQDAIEKLIFAMQQSRDCFGYNPHKVFTTNLIYKYPIEPAKTKEMKRLLDFAMGCYKNGWLESINQFQEFLKTLGIQEEE